MNVFARLSAWFYDYPQFEVNEEELAVLRAVRDGALRERDVAERLAISRDNLTPLVDVLRRKRLLGDNYKLNLWTSASEAGRWDDPEAVWLTVPGRKVLKARGIPHS